MQVDILPWSLPWKLMEVNLLPLKWVEVNLLPWTSTEASTIGESGSLHCCHQLQLPRIYSVEASMSFHIPLHTSTYFHEYHKLPAASTRLPIGPTDFRSIYFHGSWWKLPWKFPRSFLQLTWKLTWKSIYFHGSFQSVEEYLLPWKFSM